jgi:hypothetical protein
MSGSPTEFASKIPENPIGPMGNEPQNDCPVMAMMPFTEQWGFVASSKQEKGNQND